MKPETMKRWAYSLNAYCKMVPGLESMLNKETTDNDWKKKNQKVTLHTIKMTEIR